MTRDTWCGVCDENIQGGCKIHKIMRVQDQQPKPLYISSIPDILRIKILKKENLNKLENFDVFAKKQISPNVEFGPLLCEKSTHETEINANFPLVIVKDSQKLYCSFNNTSICNWMVLIKPALYKEEVNLHAYMSSKDCNIYFITVKTIYRNQELRVWYSEDYAKKIGKSSTLPSCLSSLPTEVTSKRKIKTSQKAKENFYCAVSSGDDDEDIDYDPISSKKSLKKKIKQSKNVKIEKLSNFSCKQCDLVFSKANVLNIHTLVHAVDAASTIGSLSCPDCKENFTDQLTLIHHTTKHAVINNSCLNKNRQKELKPITKRKKIQNNQLIDTTTFIQNKSNDQINKTENNAKNNAQLNETVSTKSSFTDKNEAILPKVDVSREKVSFYCKLCNKNFSTSSAFAVHNKKHSEKRFYDCALCDKSFKLYKELQEHGKKVHVRRSQEINGKLGGFDKVLLNIVGDLNDGLIKDLETNTSIHDTPGKNKFLNNDNIECNFNIDTKKQGNISNTNQEKNRNASTVSSFEVSFDENFCDHNKLCHNANMDECLNVIADIKNHKETAMNNVLNDKSSIINKHNGKTKSNEDKNNCESNTEQNENADMISRGISKESFRAGVHNALDSVLRNSAHQNTSVEESQVFNESGMIDNADVQSVESRENSDDKRLDDSLESTDDIYDCPECHRSFRSFKAISRHVRRLHNGNRYTCPVCAKQLPLLDKLKLHMLSHSSFREFVCERCGKQFKRKDKLQDHVKRLHLTKKKKNGEALDDEDEESLGSKTKFVPELPSSDYMKFTYKCYSCHLGFKRRGMLVNHMLKKHPQQSIDSVHELTLPILKYHHEFYCIYCDKVFKSNNKRKQHILKVHPGFQLPTSLRNSKSKKTNLSTPIKSAFSALTGHVAVTPSPCDLCKRQFSTKSKLHQHLRKKHNTNTSFETDMKCSNKNKKSIDKTVQKTRQQNKKQADRVELSQQTSNQQKFSFDKFNQQSNLLHSSINEVVADEKIETNVIETNETELTGPLIDPTSTNIPLMQQQQLLLDPFLSNSIYITTPYNLSTNKSYMNNKTSSNILFLSPNKNNVTTQLQDSDQVDDNNPSLMQQCLLQPSQVILLKEQAFLPDNKSSHQNNINGNALFKDNFSSEGFIIGNNVYNNIN